jgi:hypothetical protein
VPASVHNPTVNAGDLAGLGRGVDSWRSKTTELVGAKRDGPEKPVYAGFSWMVPLLPHLGHQDVYQLFDFTKSWTDPTNLAMSGIVIPAFVDPTNSHQRWTGFPHPGIALTHFVGMSGVDDTRNSVAAKLPRSDKRAGVFGYDQVARNDEITDGTSQTIMVIGAGKVTAPWVQGGGATIRGAREPYFDELSGFGSGGVSGGGTLAVMADGSVRMISKSIDPAVFRAMCTIHGADTVDSAKLDASAPRKP